MRKSGLCVKMSENPRKRKLKNSEVSEKDSKSPKVKKKSEKSVKNGGNVKKFSVKQFRKKLQEDDFISDFHQFLEIGAENPEIIAKYLDVGGQPLEIVTTLGKIDKSSLDHVTCILSVLQLILMEILSNAPQYTTIAINGCRFLLNKHRSFVELLLESHATNHRKIALKVLTACVTLDSRMGFDILKLFRSYLHGSGLVERFSKHRKEEIAHPESSLRTAFTHFVLSYLIEGNNLLIQNILDKMELLVAILSEIQFDTPENIVLVLGSLRNFVLKKLSVSKTLKFRLFSPEIVCNLLELYNWKGPKAFQALANNQSVESVLPEAEDRETVSGAVHDFLILLLTSNKYGIIVQSLGNQKKKKNIVPGVVLSRLQMPWNNPQHESLVIHVLKACPEQVEGFLRNRARFLESLEGIKFLPFLSKLISCLTPKIIQKVPGQIGMGEMGSLIKGICLNPEILDKITEKLLKNAKFEVRLNVTALLTTMLSQCNSFLVHLSEAGTYQEFEMKAIKAELLEHILGKFPKMDTITNSLCKSMEENLPPEDVLEHLEATVDLLAIAAETIPTFIDKTTSLMQLMRPLEGQDGNQSRIGLKIIKLILLLDPQIISPETPLFSKILSSFLNLYASGSGEEFQEVEILLRNILYSTRLFDSGPLEIDIWLEAFKSIDRKDINVVQEFFIKMIKKVKAKPEEVPMVSGSFPQASQENLGEILERIEKDEATLGIIHVPGLNPLLPVAANLLVKKPTVPVVKYIEQVALNLFHYLPYPEILPEILEKLSLGVSDYMKEATGGKSLAIPCEFSHPESHKLIGNIFRKGIFEESLVEVSDGKAFNFIYLIVFCHTRLHSLSQLDQESSILCSRYLLSLLKGIHARQIGHCQRKRTIELDKALKMKISRKNPISEILKYIFCSQVNLLNNFSADLESKDRPTVDFILEILKEIKEWDLQITLPELTVNFRKKLVQNFRENSTKDEDFLSLLKVFDLDQKNCLDLLKIATEKNDFHNVLVVALERITELRGNPLPGDVIRDICGIFVSVATKGTSETAINALSDALTDHLSHFHNSIGDVPEDLLQTICVGGKMTKPMTKLASLLLERNASLIPTFCGTLEGNYTKKELMYPLLGIVLARKPVPIGKDLLDRIFVEYKNGIMKSIEKPLKAGMIYRENYESSLHLIEECMSGKDCVEFTKKTLKPDSVETFQCLLIEKIYQKALANSSQTSSIHINFYKNFLNLFTILLKKPTLQIDKVMGISKILIDWPGSQLENPIDSSVTESQIWTNFSRTCLKIGLQKDQEDNSRYLLIYLLANLLDRMYQDDCGDEFPKELYEMTISHSNFLGIFLQKSSTKTATACLLVVLARKNPSGFDKAHIPLLLGAYSARMSICDQYILALLNLYEKNNIDFSEYRPFLWGDSAVSHYSLDNTEDTTLKGILEEPSMDMVISLISLETMKNTLSNFPIWRHLNPLRDLPALEITPKSSKTEIERIIDGEIPKNAKFSGILTKKQETWDEVYDPAFFVPLLSAMFAPEVFTSAVSVAQNGLLGMVFEALSSQDEEMRLAAGLALMRYKRQMEGRKDFLDRNVWLQFYTGTQNGLGALGKVTGSSCPRLPHVSANFLAKVSSLLTTPLAQLYKPISDYLLSRESFDFSVVPNFNFMFLSSDVDHQSHREFLLSVIADGIKCEEDFYVLEVSGVLETIMVFFSCPFASIDTNLRILSVINTIVRIPNCSRTLVDKFGLIPWLSGIISNLETFYYDTIDAVVHIIVNLWFSVEYLGDCSDRAEICRMAVKMVKFISARMPMVLLSKFIRVLNKTSHGRYHLLSPSDLDHLIECAKPLIASQITSIRYIRENGAAYAGNCAKNVLKDDSEDRMGLINLREYVINWTASDRK
ncbi:uncharacterized protein LOC129803658 [Phlebotomus papatasi]|uniref:uncharacterized protein LOC129803658 n=1 Tax=Phlebotomus papatasi TaxID=29031 RepID=UPI0024844278|nr:uncharacterized protein LOC129803658 [Phlebotomus papatasi]